MAAAQRSAMAPFFQFVTLRVFCLTPEWVLSDEARRAQALPEPRRQAEAVDREHLPEALSQAGRSRGILRLQPPRWPVMLRNLWLR